MYTLDRSSLLFGIDPAPHVSVVQHVAVLLATGAGVHGRVAGAAEAGPATRHRFLADERIEGERIDGELRGDAGVVGVDPRDRAHRSSPGRAADRRSGLVPSNRLCPVRRWVGAAPRRRRCRHWISNSWGPVKTGTTARTTPTVRIVETSE